MKRRNRILVTGGAGFLGSHLCERLLAQDNEVICVDNYYTGSRENIAGALSHPNFEAIRHDITFPLYVEVDRIYNLGCPASPVHYQFDPVQTTKVSVHGAINMLGLAKRVRAPILQASTSEVYGDPGVHPQTEDYWGHVNPIGPRACYDEGKRCAETLFFDYRRQHDIPIKIARIFNTYGPRMHVEDGRVVSSFVACALRGEPITIYGDGEQTRSFCYVDDLIDGLVTADGHAPRGHRADQSRQYGRDHHPGACRYGDRPDRLEIENRPPGAAQGRSAAAVSGHLQGGQGPWLDADHTSGSRAREDDRLFRAAAGYRAHRRRSRHRLRRPRIDRTACTKHGRRSPSMMVEKSPR